MLLQIPLEFIVNFVTPFIEKMPDISFVSDGIAYVLSWVNGVLYFLPWSTVSMILSLILLLFVVRVVIALLKALWSVLPVV